MAQQWRAALPVVVRRDVDDRARVPVGVRGMKREQRAAGWVQARNIVRSVTPEMLVDREVLLHSPLSLSRRSSGAIALTYTAGPGLGRHRQYRLRAGNRDPGAACGQRSGSALIRAPQPLDREALLEWQTRVAQLPCRADTQVETPYGAFALNEWLRDGRALLKTSRGATRNRDAVAQGGIMKILFTFPGRGGQRPGMLAALPDREAILTQARAVLGDEVDTLDSADALQHTRAVQLCLLIAGVAWARELQRQGVDPQMVSGLSIGAFPVMVIAGALDFASAAAGDPARGP